MAFATPTAIQDLKEILKINPDGKNMVKIYKDSSGSSYVQMGTVFTDLQSSTVNGLITRKVQLYP